MEQAMFYLRSRHGDVGSNVMFHNKDGKGYGTNLDNLHLFTKDEAQKYLGWDVRSLPLLKSEVDALAIRGVDHQYLDDSKQALNPQAKYVIQVTQMWNGNDIYFQVDGGRTFNYDEAKEYGYDDALLYAACAPNAVVWSKEFLDTIARRTFQAENINTRKMITSAGIKYKQPRKPRESTGKTRHNCPSCRQFVWDHNPHEAPYCSNCCE